MPGPEQRLRALEDREAIRDLIARFGVLADAGDAAGLAALFTPEGCYDVGGWGVLKGTEALHGIVDNPNHRAWMARGVAHVLSPPAIDLDGDRAMARNHSIVMLRDADAGWQAERVAANCWHLSRQSDGRWLIAQRINRLLDGDAGAVDLLAGGGA